MKIIVHRRNTIAELQAASTRYGIEIDLRSFGDTIIVQHDPFRSGDRFGKWLEHYRHGTLILNVKEEGLEPTLISMMRERGIYDYFFLDQSFPFLVRWAAAADGRSAVRISEYESMDSALALSGKIQWVWVDCFTRFPLTANQVYRLKECGFKLCLVSPELHGAAAVQAIPAMAAQLRSDGIQCDAVCTKQPELWQREIET